MRRLALLAGVLALVGVVALGATPVGADANDYVEVTTYQTAETEFDDGALAFTTLAASVVLLGTVLFRCYRR